MLSTLAFAFEATRWMTGNPVLAEARELLPWQKALETLAGGALALACGTLVAWAAMNWPVGRGVTGSKRATIAVVIGVVLVCVLQFTTAGLPVDVEAVARAAAALGLLAASIWFVRKRRAAASLTEGSPLIHVAPGPLEEIARLYLKSIPLPGWIVDREGRYRFVNDTWLADGEFEASPVGRKLSEVYPPERASEYEAVNARVLRENRLVEAEHHTPAGMIHVYLFPLRDGNGETLIGGVGVDVTERQRVSGLLRAQGELLAAVTEAMRSYLQTGDWRAAHEILLRGALQQTKSARGFVGVIVANQRLRVLAHVGMSWETIVGADEWRRATAEHASSGWLEFGQFEALSGRLLTSGGVVIANAADPADDIPAAPDLLVLPVQHAQQTVGLLGVGGGAEPMSREARERLETLVQQAGVLSDSYRRSLREVSLEEQVRVAQKMEAVGLLAGGVAHDFNNLLQVIQGYTAMALDSGSTWPERKSHLDQVKAAAERAAQLTQQLLAFGRQQTLRKSDLDLNQAISELLKMLRRVLGEQISVDFIPGHDLGNVYADRAQIDQVVLNLCVNARDALAAGGRITLETENVLVNGAFRESHPWAKPGRYVLLTVTDNGVGMDRETLSHVFEPFFTTKPTGKGTGLGLAVVYGVIKQHDGMIHVYSEPGQGTTFKIYLPIVARSATAVGPKHTPVPARGSETILLAEDEPMVRELAIRILQRSGYRVIVAVDGVEACAKFEAHQNDIALIVLDVVMPNLGGREAYERITKLKPGLPVIFCSGYAGAALDGSVLNVPGTQILAKPYGADDLLHRVRSALDFGKSPDCK